ncbi:MAG TPA: hypothetical protein VFO94_16150 [Gammaproteobacteria bacterium]|nr:hypothetical protein [Gammaproteobacteria bacterium]
MSADDTTLEPPAAPAAAAASFVQLMLRPTLFLVAGYAINTSVHELAHALAALWLGVPSTLFHSYVSVDLASQSPYVQGVVRAAGPVVSLVLGVLCWFAHRGLRGWWAELPLFYVAVFGVARFLASLFSVALTGDFNDMAAALGLSMSVRYAVGGVGAFLLIGFAFDIGRELREWVPPGVGMLKGTAAVVLVPALVGTAAILLVYQPLAVNAAEVRPAESGVWIFAALGALVGSARPSRTEGLDARRIDWLYVLAVVLVLRIMAIGIPLMP